MLSNPPAVPIWDKRPYGIQLLEFRLDFTEWVDTKDVRDAGPQAAIASNIEKELFEWYMAERKYMDNDLFRKSFTGMESAFEIYLGK